MLLGFVFFRKVSLSWEGSLEKWISYTPKEGRNRYAALLVLPHKAGINLKRRDGEVLEELYLISRQRGGWRGKMENTFSAFALTCGTCTGTVFFSSGCAGAQGCLRRPLCPLVPGGLR